MGYISVLNRVEIQQKSLIQLALSTLTFQAQSELLWPHINFFYKFILYCIIVD